jgi:hypothetical protein
MSGLVADWDALRVADPEVADAVSAELERERTTLRLIASENYTTPAVLAALASTMTNKYAEGYPGRRYYGGCEWVDVVETLAIERCSAPTTRTCSHTPVPRRTSRCSAPSSIRARTIGCSACRSPTAVTSHMGRP